MNPTTKTYGGSMSESVEKAEFKSEIGNVFKVQFNPTDIQLTAKATWQQQELQADKALLEFKKVDPRQLTMTLIFDTTSNNSDVRKAYVNHLMSTFVLQELPDQNPNHDQNGQGTIGQKNKKRNALQTFTWGEFSFFGALTALDTKYTMFAKDGTPIRAEVKVTLLEYQHQSAFDVGAATSNITIPQVKLVQLQSGQSLSSLASMAGMAVGALAAMNGISDPMNVPPGQVVMLPGGN